MKKVQCISLISAMALALIACSDDTNRSSSEPADSEDSNINEISAESEGASEDEEATTSTNTGTSLEEVGSFDPNQGGGGFANTPYLKNAIHPSDSNWTRQSRFVGPENPELKSSFELPERLRHTDLTLGIDDEENLYIPISETSIQEEHSGMYAFTKDGELIWNTLNLYEEYDISETDRTSPILDESGAVYSLMDSNAAVSFDRLDGSILSTYEQPESNVAGDGYPIVLGENNDLYYVSDGQLLSFSVDGEENWRVGYMYDDRYDAADDDPDPKSGPTVGASGNIYVQGYEYLMAFDAEGNDLWQNDFPSSIYDSNIILDEDENLYFVNKDTIYSFSKDGEERWRNETGKDYFGGIVGLSKSEDGQLVAMFEDGLRAFDLEGNERWHQPDLNGFGSTVIDANGTIYYTSLGTIYAGTSEGEPKWELKLDDARDLAVPVIGPEGQIYVLDERGYVYILGEN